MEIWKDVVGFERALSLLVCEKNRPKGLELLDELHMLGGKNGL